MARIHLHVHVQGNMSNAEALELQAGAKAFCAGCQALGLEVRGDGLTVELDEEVAAEPPSAPAAPIQDEEPA